MPHRTRAATISRLSGQRTRLCKRLGLTDIRYLDLGLEYHALPLQLRQGFGNVQTDTRKAFTATQNDEADIVGYLLDLRQLCTAAEHHLLHYDVEAAEMALHSVEETLSAMEDQLVAIQKRVDALHRRFSAALDEDSVFDERVEYRPSLRKDDGAEKYRLLRDWVLVLPQVQGWLRNGVAANESEALMMAVCAGGEGSEISSNLGVDWRADEKMPDRSAKRLRMNQDGRTVIIVA